MVFRCLALIAALLGGGGAGAETLRIAVISDMNGSYGTTDYSPAVLGAVKAIIARRPDLVISTGDMIAGQRRNPKFTKQELSRMWAAFHATVSTPLAVAGIPLLVTPGNHDASAYPGFEEERTAFAQTWAARPPQIDTIDTADWPFRVAASMRGVLMIGMDATRSGPLSRDDVVWVQRILEAEAGRHRRVILFGHLPLMPIAQGREADVLDDPALYALAQAGGVDIWLSGHHHAFYSGVVGGILFVAQGALGGGPRKLIGTATRSLASFSWIEINDAGHVSVTAISAPDFTSPMAVDQLPLSLGTGPYALTRQMSLRD